MTVGAKPRTLADLLADAEQRITRLRAEDAHAAMASGALLVDIRSESNRARDGIVPGSLHIPRTVLEWRTAPDSEFRNPHIGDLDRHLILICDHGCSTILAAAVLSTLGYTRCGDVVGGFAAWRDAALPIVSAPDRPPDDAGLPGMEPPDS